MYRRLKQTRIAVSLICIIILTGTTVGLLPSAIGQMLVKIQFMHLLLGASLLWLALWLIVTLLCGRIYCSTVCPMGTLFDIFARLLHRRSYTYSPGFPLLRALTAILILHCLMLPLPFSMVPTLLDPDSAYAVICREVFCPVAEWAKGMAVSPPVYAASAGALGLLVALLLLAAAAAVAAMNGRIYCNTICPAGTILSLISRNSILHFDLNTDLCTHCGLCSDVCKASCIDHNGGTVDMSRCVVCFNCTDVCPCDAISYTTRRHRLATPLMRRIKGLSPDAMGGASGDNRNYKTHKNETIP